MLLCEELYHRAHLQQQLRRQRAVAAVLLLVRPEVLLCGELLQRMPC
jgi:hypothetical protein